MPHDANGNLLKVGDKVTVNAIVSNISAQEDYCNLTINIPAKNETEVETNVTLNTKQVFKESVAEPADTKKADTDMQKRSTGAVVEEMKRQPAQKNP